MKTKGTGYTPGLGPLVKNAIVSQLDLCHRFIDLQGLCKSLTGAAQTIKSQIHPKSSKNTMARSNLKQAQPELPQP